MTWANVDHSGYKFSVYGGLQKNILHPGSFTLVGNEIERLVPNDSKTTNFLWGLGAAYRFILPPQKNILRYLHDIDLGLDLYYFQTNQSGIALDFNESPDFDYKLRIQSLRVMGNLEFTLLPVTSKIIYPFIVFGAGLASNTNHYHDLPNANSPTGVGVSFDRNATMELAFALGAGVKWMLCRNTEISLRYLYANLGSVKSSKDANLAVSSQYSFPLTTQSLSLGISYLA